MAKTNEEFMDALFAGVEAAPGSKRERERFARKYLEIYTQDSQQGREPPSFERWYSETPEGRAAQDRLDEREAAEAAALVRRSQTGPVAARLPALEARKARHEAKFASEDNPETVRELVELDDPTFFDDVQSATVAARDELGGHAHELEGSVGTALRAAGALRPTVAKVRETFLRGIATGQPGRIRRDSLADIGEDSATGFVEAHAVGAVSDRDWTDTVTELNAREAARQAAKQAPLDALSEDELKGELVARLGGRKMTPFEERAGRLGISISYPNSPVSGSAGPDATEAADAIRASLDKAANDNN